MVVAGRVSQAVGLLSAGEAGRIERLIERAGLLEGMPSLDTEALLAAMRHDKKVVDGQLRFVLLRAIGDVFVSEDVGDAQVKTALEAGR
jgi:3-dehydroquinate synthase